MVVSKKRLVYREKKESGAECVLRWVDIAAGPTSSYCLAGCSRRHLGGGVAKKCFQNQRRILQIWLCFHNSVNLSKSKDPVVSPWAQLQNLGPCATLFCMNTQPPSSGSCEKN